MGALFAERLQARTNQLGSALFIVVPIPVEPESFPAVVDGRHHSVGSLLFDDLDDHSPTVARRICAEQLQETVVPGWQIAPSHDLRGSRFRIANLRESGHKPFVEHSATHHLGPPNAGCSAVPTRTRKCNMIPTL